MTRCFGRHLQEHFQISGVSADSLCSACFTVVFAAVVKLVCSLEILPSQAYCSINQPKIHLIPLQKRGWTGAGQALVALNSLNSGSFECSPCVAAQADSHFE